MKYEILIPAILMIAAAAAVTIRSLRHKFIIPEGFAGLLYKHGKFVSQLSVVRRSAQHRSAGFADRGY